MKRITLIAALILAPFAISAQDAEEDFFGDEAPAVTTATSSATDPTKLFSESAEGVRWGGTVDSHATWNGGWVDQWPTDGLSKGWNDSLDYGLSTKLFVDGRPDKDFRFRLSLKTGYPFTTDSDVLTSASYSALGPSVTTSSTTLKIPNIKVWELFTDVTIQDTLFLRFGKQSASWGVSYFYSPGDVISLTAKDAADPTAEREGPVALKATLPFPNQKANLTAFVIARDTYFEKELPSVKNLGYALQGDILVGDAQITLGGFFQKDNAPKGVATINTGLGGFNLPVLSDINLFSEAVVSYGSDVLKGTGDAGGYYAHIDPWDKKLYYTGTVGASYSNSDANLTLRGEYLYNPFGSNDKHAAQLAYNTMFAALGGAPLDNSADRAYGFGDAATPGMHNVTGLLSLAKVGGSDKLTFSTLWQQNLSDGSGWVKPSFTLTPWDVLSFNWGLSLVYGDDGTQYPLQFQAYDKDKVPLGPKRVTFNVGVTFGTGKY